MLALAETPVCILSGMNVPEGCVSAQQSVRIDPEVRNAHGLSRGLKELKKRNLPRTDP